jgi:lysophospholipase L1-like esterase
MNHKPRLSLEEFHEKYIHLIRLAQKKGKVPLLLSLPPIDPERFFEGIIKGRNKENILKAMNHQINKIFTWHSMYNLEVFKIASEANVPIMDITTYFLRQPDYREFLCDDGMHPNHKGHLLIAQALSDFYKKYV